MIELFIFMKTLQSNLSYLESAFSSSATLKRLSGDRSSLTSELESDIYLEDLPMR
jgi:hypothetical protein